jgi:hypothetical protein|tara:strand:- start:3177 stop:4034 length:858 start_codon:yes stop_codon:yes gene_type:complete
MTDTTNQQVEETKVKSPTPSPYVGKDRVFQTKEEITKEADSLKQTIEPAEDVLPEKNTGTKHDYKKRYDDLKSHYDSKLSEWRKEKEEILIQLQDNKKSNMAMPKTAEELQLFKQKHPDVYDVIETVASMKTDSRIQDVEEHLNILREKEFELSRQNAQKELLNHHPDFLDLKDSEEFVEWLKDQPDNIAEGVTKNATDVKWAVRTVDLYKLDKGIGKQKSKSKKPSDAAKAVKTSTASQDITDKNSNKKIWTYEEIARLKPHQFEKVEEEIELANREGRIREQL